MSLTKQKKSNFFNSLQVFRGLAALMVVYHHQWISFSYFFDVQDTILLFIATLGKHGVDFFFVLSGFIITYSCYNKKAGKLTIKSYLINRVFRIYIPYLPISICMLLLYHLFPNISGSSRSISLITSLTLFPDGLPALSVAWTLIHEMMFYLLFIIWFFSRKGWFIFTLVWTMVIVYLNWINPLSFLNSIPILKYLISSYNLEFIIGFYSAIFIKKHAILANKNIFLLISFILFGIGLVLKWYGWNFTFLIFAFGFALLILGSLGSRLDKVNASSLLMLIGNASYSIYLIHNPEISILIRLFTSYLTFMSEGMIFIAIFISCCVTGILYSKVFEVFLLGKAKSKFLPIPPMKHSFTIAK
ncbi:acyltransferase family protein [Cyclobacterium marinum]|uniref:acyltransferase family protein n=1 Tax=Cyclobacterium marinum TaxID=104 RepID=UPI0011EF5511|nr:acyltransferase [Cyclobacterium marinum]MBI0397181.1 acyltransferase [Cyclobacterium marinum]